MLLLRYLIPAATAALLMIPFQALLPKVAVAKHPHFDSEESLCTEGNWFLGYNKSAKIYYSVIDVHPTQDYFVVGGSHNQQGTVYGSQEQYQYDDKRRLQMDSSGAIILIYEKGAGEPTEIFYVRKQLTLTNSDSNDTFNVQIMSIDTLSIDTKSSLLKFSGVFSTDLNKLIFFSYKAGDEQLQIFTFESRYSLHGQAYSCWQYSKELMGFIDGSSNDNSLEYVAYFQCGRPQNYYITFFQQGTDEKVVMDSLYFRQIDSNIGGYLEETWYLSATESLSSESLSWIGHGILGTERFLYLETVKLNDTKDQFSHLSFLMFSLEQMAENINALEGGNVYPISLVSRQDQKWAIVAEVANTHILVIQGTSVESPKAEFFGYLSLSDSQTLKVLQVIAIGDNLQLLLKSDQHTIFVGAGAISGQKVQVINVDDSFSSRMQLLTQRISYFNMDASQRIYGLGARDGVGFVIQQPENPDQACIKLSILEKSDGSLTLDSTELSSILDIDQSTAQIEHDNSQGKVFQLNKNYSTDNQVKNIVKNKLKNPCSLSFTPIWDSYEAEILINQLEYDADDETVFNVIDYKIDGTCPGSEESIILEDLKFLKTSYEIEIGTIELESQTKNDQQVIQSYQDPLFKTVPRYSTSQDQLQVNEGNLLQPLAQGDEYKVSYEAVTIDDFGNRFSGPNTTKTVQVYDYYEICKDQLTVPDVGSLDREVLGGAMIFIPMHEFQMDDCKFNMLKTTVTVSDGLKTQAPDVKLVKTTFSKLSSGAGGLDHDLFSVVDYGYLEIDSTNTLDITSRESLTVELTIKIRHNYFEYSSTLFNVTITWVCGATFSDEPGPLELSYTVMSPELTFEYVLTQQNSECRSSPTRFELRMADSSVPLTYAEVDQKFILTVWTDDLSFIGTQHQVELVEIDTIDEFSFKSSFISINFTDPCILEKVEPILKVYHEQADKILSIWWQPFTGQLYDTLCPVNVIEIQINGQTFTKSTPQSDPLAYIDFSSRTIDINLDGTDDAKQIKVIINEAVVLFDDSFGMSKSSQIFKVPIRYEIDDENFNLDFLKDLLDPPYVDEVQEVEEIPDWVFDLPASTNNDDDDEDNQSAGASSETDDDDEKNSEIIGFIVPAKKQERQVLRNPDADPLEIETIKFSRSGMITILFSKNLYDTSDYFGDNDTDNGIDQILQMKVTSDQYSKDANETAIDDISLIRFSGNQVDIQITFQKPDYISVSMASPEYLEIKLLQPEAFVDSAEEVTLAMDAGSVVTLSIPSQLSQALAAQVKAFDEAIDQPITYVSQLTLATNLVLAYGLKYMWSMFNVLQFLVFIGEWKINVDPFVETLLEQLKKLALFEFIDTKPIKDEIQNAIIPSQRRRLRALQSDMSDDSESEGEDLEDPSASRFGSSDLLDNSGMMIFIGVVLVLIMLILLLLRFLLRKYAKVREIVTKIIKKVFFNALIRFTMQSTLKMQIASATVLALTKDSNGSTTSAIATIVVFNLVAVMYAFVLIFNRDRLHEPRIQQRIGSLYLDVSPKKVGSMLHPTMFMLRRSLFVLISFALIDYPGLQVVSLIFSSIGYITYLNLFVDYLERGTKRFELANESFFLLSSYVFMILTNSGVIPPEQRAQLGLSLLAILSLLMLVNFTVIVRANIKKVSQKSFLGKLKKQQKRVMNERRIAIETIESAMHLNETFNFGKVHRKLQVKNILKQEIERVKQLTADDLETAVFAIRRKRVSKKERKNYITLEKKKLQIKMRQLAKELVVDQPSQSGPDNFIEQQQVRQKIDPAQQIEVPQSRLSTQIDRSQVLKLSPFDQAKFTRRSSPQTTELLDYDKYNSSPRQQKSNSLSYADIEQPQERETRNIDTYDQSIDNAFNYQASEVSYTQNSPQNSPNQSSTRFLLRPFDESGTDFDQQGQSQFDQSQKIQDRKIPKAVEVADDNSFSSFESDQIESPRVTIAKTTTVKSRFGQAAKTPKGKLRTIGAVQSVTTYPAAQVQRPSHLDVFENRRQALQLVNTVLTMKEKMMQGKSTKEAKSIKLQISDYEVNIRAQLGQIPK